MRAQSITQVTINSATYTQLELFSPQPPAAAAAPAPAAEAAPEAQRKVASAKKPRRTKKRSIKPVPVASGSGAAILAIAERLDAIGDAYLSLEDPIYDRVGGCGLCSTSCLDRDEVCEACELCSQAWANSDAAVAARNAWARHREHAQDVRQAAAWARDLPEADQELLAQATLRLAASLTRREAGWLDLWPALQDPPEVKVLIKCVPHLVSLPVGESPSGDLFEAPEADSPLNERELAVLRMRARRLFDLPVDDSVVPTGIFADDWNATGDVDDDAWALMDFNLALAVQAARRGHPTVDLGPECADDEIDPRYVATRELLAEYGVLDEAA